MIDFDNSEKFTLVHHFRIPAIYTWGSTDRDKREEIRRVALMNFPEGPFNYEWYGIRIKVRRYWSDRNIDLENVPKLIIDAFSGWQIKRDRSEYPQAEIYVDDVLYFVRAIQLEGELTENEDETEVWIFGRK